MSAPGGAIYLGRAFGLIASDLKRIVQTLCDIRVSRAEAWLDDVPVLIRALSFTNESIRADARKCLTKLAGDDLGAEPAAWETWWQTRGAELRRQRESETGLEGLFAGFRAALMEGRWGDAAGFLHVKIVTGGAEVDAARLIKRNRRALRQAYRDACLEHIEINGDSAKLTVGWGKVGFDFHDLRARRTDGKWLFGSPPWGTRLAEQPSRPVTQKRPARHIQLKPWRPGFSSAVIAVVLAWIGVGFLALFLLAVVDVTESWLGPALFAFPFVLGGGILLYALICTRIGTAPNERVSERPPGKPEEGGSLRSGGRSAEPADSTPRRKPKRRFRPVRRVTGGRVLVAGTASALFVLFVLGGLGRPVAVVFLIMVGVTLAAAGAVELRWAVRKAREGAGDAEEPVFPLRPEYNAFPPVVIGCVLTIAAIVSGGLCGIDPGALAGLGAGAAFLAPIIIYTAQHLHRRRRWMQATVEGRLERWQRPDSILAKLEKRIRPGFSIILLKALVLSLVFILPALLMIIEAFGGVAREVSGGIALSAFLAPFPVAYAIHKSIHEPE